MSGYGERLLLLLLLLLIFIIMLIYEIFVHVRVKFVSMLLRMDIANKGFFYLYCQRCFVYSERMLKIWMTQYIKARVLRSILLLKI